MRIILRWKNFNYMLEIDILRNESQKYEYPEGYVVFPKGFWVPEDTQAPCWLLRL